MIPEFFLTITGGLLKAVLGILPNLPAAPSWMEASLDTVVTTMVSGIHVVSYLYSPTILIFILGTALAIFQFENVYHGVMWIVRKLPLGIK